MPRYRAKQNYTSNLISVREGDEVEMTAEEAAFVERDSAGTFEELGLTELEEAAVATDEAGKFLTMVREQQPTIDLDIEDKLKEIPGEGNKRTPARGIMPPESSARVVKPTDRMVRGTGNADDVKNISDTHASARVTSETPASAAATERFVENNEQAAKTAEANAKDEKSNANPPHDEGTAPDLPDDDDQKIDSTAGTPTSRSRNRR